MRLPSPCVFRIAQLAAATLAAFASGGASEASRGHASVVGWKRGTLAATYLYRRFTNGSPRWLGPPLLGR
eukprot:5326918-Prymnesium_polylepis.1